MLPSCEVDAIVKVDGGARGSYGMAAAETKEDPALRQRAIGLLTTPLSRVQNRRTSRVMIGRFRLQGGLRLLRLDDAGVFQVVLDARCTGPRDASWRYFPMGRFRRI
jgi:hypothetical protein